MTLPSLCSAIRSQLYFSQISAWCDLIKKSDKNIYDTGRFIFTTPPTTSAAGDLATTTGNVLSTSPSGTATTTNAANTSSSSSHSSSGVGGNSTNRKAPRLNIFYRIKTYDNNSACFNSKPNVHNFPNVNVSENSSVSVCLKSLPRISGGIPKVGPVSAATANTSTIVVAATTESSTTTSANTLQGTHATTTTRATAAGSWVMNSVPKAAISASTNAAGTTNTNKPITKFLTMNCDNKDSKEYHQQQQQQQQTAVFNANYLNCGNPHPHDNDEIARDGARHDFPTNVRSQALGKLTEEGGGFGGSVGDDDSFNGDFESCGAVAYNCDHAGGSGGGGVDGDSSNSSLSTNFGNLSHREKQLLKYRKRMLKRDKKHQQQRKTNDGNVISQANEQAQKMEQGEDDDDDDDDREEDQNEMATMSSRSKENETDVKNTTKGQRQQQLPNSFINSIPSKHGRRQQEQQQHVKMISTGTQTTITNNASTTCSSCGFEKSMICLKCNPLRSPNAAASIIDDYKFDHEDGMDVQESPTMSSGSVSSSSSSACSLSSSDIIHTPRNKAELLLQAIQRTPKSNKKLKITKDLQHHHKEQHTTTTKKQTLSAPATQSTKVNNNNGSHSRASPSNTSISSSSSSSSLNGSSIIQIQSCQVCKRQKTQHNFQQPTTPLEATSPEDCSPTAESKSSCTSSSLVICSSSQSNGNQSDDVLGESENETDGGKMSTTEDCVDNVPIVNTAANCSAKESCDIKTTSDIFKAHEVMEEVSELLEFHLSNLFIKGVGGII